MVLLCVYIAASVSARETRIAAAGNAICHGIVMDNTVLLVTSMMQEREGKSMTHDYMIPSSSRRRKEKSTEEEYVKG